MNDEHLAMQLAEAAVARLCHDLSGALGTVVNAIDLAAADNASGDMAQEALELAGEAAREISAQLRLARLLWGRDATVAQPEILALAGALTHGRVRIDARQLQDAVLASDAARLLACLLLLAMECLRGPGRVVLAGAAGGSMLISLDGLRADWPDVLPGLIGDPATLWGDLDARGLIPRLAVLLARRAGMRLSFMLAPRQAPGPPPLLISPI